MATASGPTHVAHIVSSMNRRFAAPLVTTVRPPTRGRRLNSAVCTVNLGQQRASKITGSPAKLVVAVIAARRDPAKQLCGWRLYMRHLQDCVEPDTQLLGSRWAPAGQLVEVVLVCGRYVRGLIHVAQPHVDVRRRARCKTWKPLILMGYECRRLAGRDDSLDRSVNRDAAQGMNRPASLDWHARYEDQESARRVSKGTAECVTGGKMSDETPAKVFRCRVL